METQLTESNPLTSTSTASQSPTSARPSSLSFAGVALNHPEWLAGAGIVLGVFADLLFYGKPIGISYPIVVTTLTVTLFVFARLEEKTISRANLWVGFAAVVLAVLTAMRAAPFLEFLNYTGSIVLLILFLKGLTTRPLSSLNLGQYALELLKAPIIGALVPLPVLARGAHRLKNLQSSTARQVITGLVIAIPILIVFSVLFAAADLIFNNMVGIVVNFLHFDNLIGHLMLTLILSWVAVAAIGFAVSRPDDTADALPDSERASHKFRFLGMIESGIVLGSVNALFLLFVGIQFAALFGGQTFIEAQGITYSEYARRGFFELVAVAVMALSMILVLDFITKRETDNHQRVFTGASTALVVMTVIVLTSAFQRMTLYEQAFGFTRLRVYTHVFMVWLAVMLGAFLVMLYGRRTYMFATALLIGSVFYVVTLNAINPDAFIARQNIERYEEAGEELDLYYLALLSEDALPIWAPLLHDDDLEELAGGLLHSQLNTLDARQHKWGWPSYHVSRDRAYHLLDTDRELIESYEPEYVSRYYYNSPEYNGYR